MIDAGYGLRWRTLPSPFGELIVVWRGGAPGEQVWRVLLPTPEANALARLAADDPHARPGSCAHIDALCAQMERFLAGEDVRFGLDDLAIERCAPFQRRVLAAEHAIPRGWVSSYGHIAAHLGQPGAARAVGNALARNPFPILVPCHRAIRSDGALGGFQGGLAMKRALLTLEGVTLAGERVVRPRDAYSCE